MANIVHHHAFGLVRHYERIGIPAPIAVEKHAVWQKAFHFLADGGFAHTHCAADKINRFHTPLFRVHHDEVLALLDVNDLNFGETCLFTEVNVVLSVEELEILFGIRQLL